MLRVGLTGGIGAGKSTVARRLAELGATVVDADAVAREVVEPGTPGLAAVVARFGEGVLAADGSLDRPALGSLVFADDAARRDLERIVHPLVGARSRELMAGAPADGVVVYDVPLLVEKHLGPDHHLVVVVDAPEEERVARLVRDRGMAEGEARRRIASQASPEQRRAAADAWLDNATTPADLVARVDGLWDGRIAPYAANLAAGVRVRRAGAVVLADPDPEWPARGARLVDRLRHVLGGRAVTVDHVGSTSVPGLVAKDVLDVQVGLRDLADADGEELVGLLAVAGFPRASTDPDRSKDGTPWPQRLHGGCDPAQVVHVHLREAGSPGWRWALAFRDWLRSDAQARQAYAALKLGLAGRLRTGEEYAAAKEPWFDEAAGRLEAWVTRTGWRPGGAPAQPEADAAP